VTSVTKGRDYIFEDPRACRFLIKCLEYYKLILSFKLYCFVIMPEHIHFLIQPLNGVSTSKIMNYIKGNFSRKYNFMNDCSGSLWQRRFYESGIRGMEHLLREMNYIHYNPVRAGLVTLPGDYEFSSYNRYVTGAYRDLVDVPM
jgi:putative transposase